MNHYPDAYECATGETVPFGVSYNRDRARYTSEHAGEPGLYTTGAKESAEHPGFVKLTTVVHGEDGFREHLVPLDVYQEADSRRTRLCACSISATSLQSWQPN